MVRMPHWPTPLLNREIHLRLDRMIELLPLLGHPELKLPPIIHVAGTNGKGSTIAYLKAICEAAGLKVHCYTSPHLVRFNERIVLAGHEIDDYYLKEILERVRLQEEKLSSRITFFEGVTVAAFLAFAEVKADILLLETGMGGRLDATNLIASPLVTIITPISFDHMEYLGDSLATIAFEKAGIMKAGSPCVVTYQEAEALNIINLQAEKLDIPLIAYQYDFGIEKIDNGFIYKSSGQADFTLPTPSLVGDHQLLNAAGAIAAIKTQQLFTITDQQIIHGLTHTKWPGRLQHLTSGHLVDLLSKDWQLWIDGAHNLAGGEAIASWADEKQDKPLYLILGMTRGRDVAKFLTPISSLVKQAYGVFIEAEPSSHTAAFVANAANSIGVHTMTSSGIEEALCEIAGLEPGYILICGSLFLAGDALALNLGKPLR